MHATVRWGFEGQHLPHHRPGQRAIIKVPRLGREISTGLRSEPGQDKSSGRGQTMTLRCHIQLGPRDAALSGGLGGAGSTRKSSSAGRLLRPFTRSPRRHLDLLDEALRALAPDPRKLLGHVRARDAQARRFPGPSCRPLVRWSGSGGTSMAELSRRIELVILHDSDGSEVVTERRRRADLGCHSQQPGAGQGVGRGPLREC